MTVLAAAIALVGSLFFALGAAVQQFEAVGSARPGLLALLRRPRWLLGGVCHRRWRRPAHRRHSD